MLLALPGFLRTVLSTVVVLGVVVSIHEFGHYLAARLCGFHVEAFSIGFGRAIASWQDRHGTKWQIGWLPLGGFVRLHGQQRPEDMTPEERALLRPGEGFHDKTIAARAFVTVAGPLANFILTGAIFVGLALVIGQQVAMPVIGEVSPNQAAARAGLHTGDQVLGIDGAKTATFDDIKAVVVAHPGQALALTVQRGAAQLKLTATPDQRPGPDGKPIGTLGITSGQVAYHSIGMFAALRLGVLETWSQISQTAQGLWQIVTGRRGLGEVHGLLGIAQVSGQAAARGVEYVVWLVAVLSVNLGLLNLLPIPVLDGGHLVLYGLEAVRGRPLAPKVQEYVFRVGLGLILLLMVYANSRDFTQLVRHMIG